MIGIFKKPDTRPLLLMEFRSMLNSVYSELIVGQSLRTSLSVTLALNEIRHKDLSYAIVTLDKAINHGISEVQAWEAFAEKIDEFYVYQFVSTLSATYSYSGNVAEVVQHSVVALSDAIDLTLEVDIIMASKRMEFHIMTLMPLILLLILSINQAEYMMVLYESFIGRIVMTCILCLMTIAYLLGKHLSKVEL